MDAKTLRRRRATQWTLIGCGIVMVALGLWRGEVRAVLTKAVNICLECIGIG